RQGMINIQPLFLFVLFNWFNPMLEFFRDCFRYFFNLFSWDAETDIIAFQMVSDLSRRSYSDEFRARNRMKNCFLCLRINYNHPMLFSFIIKRVLKIGRASCRERKEK